jgi:hypothetical protein
MTQPTPAVTSPKSAAHAAKPATSKPRLPEDFEEEAIARLEAAEHPFTLDVSAKRRAELVSGERDFSLEQPTAFDVDEPLPVGQFGIKPQRAVRRAMDPDNRTLLDLMTNRRTKYLGLSTRPRVPRRPPVSVTENPAAVLTHRFSEVTELNQVFDEAVARVGNLRSLTPTQIKDRINRNIRNIINNGSTPSGAAVRDALRSQGFEYVRGRGIVAVRRP